ncbi:MAG: DUF3471 domain-containing protein [Janthinobacterium lividum]
MVAQVQLVPELHLGSIVLANQDNRAAFTAVSNFIEDHYLGLTGLDRVQELVTPAAALATVDAQAKATVWQQVAAAQKAAPKRPDYTPYLGRYHDAWFGDVTVYQQGTQLWWKAARSPRLLGQLLPYRGNTYVVRWKDRTIDANAFTAFTLDPQGRAASIKMDDILHAPASDFKYLDLRRVE